MADSDDLPDIPMRIPSLDEMAEIESWMLPRDEGGSLHMLREVEVFCGIGPGGARKTRRELIAVMLPNRSHTHIWRREQEQKRRAEAEARTAAGIESDNDGVDDQPPPPPLPEPASESR